MDSQDNDGFVEYVSKRKKKSQDKKEANEVLRRFLLSEILKDECILHVVGKCRKGNACSFGHSNLNEPIYSFAKNVYYDFTSIKDIDIRRGDVIRFIMKTLNNGMNINLTNCIFHIKGTKCRNERGNRLIELPIKFGERSVVINICYADTNKCKHALLCGLHIDFVIEETVSRFNVVDIISDKDTRTYHKHKRWEEEKVVEKVIDTTSASDFPEFGNSSDATSVISTASAGSSVSAKSGYGTAILKNPMKMMMMQKKARKRKKNVKITVERVDESESGVSNSTYKTALCQLNKDDFKKLAEDIFCDDVDSDEEVDDRITRLEKENIILFKRNTELTDQLLKIMPYITYLESKLYTKKGYIRESFRSRKEYVEHVDDDDGDDGDDGDDDGNVPIDADITEDNDIQYAREESVFFR